MVANDFRNNWFWKINQTILQKLNGGVPDQFKIGTNFKISNNSQLHYALGISESNKGGRAINGNGEEGLKVCLIS